MGGHVVIPVGGVQGVSLSLLLQSKLTANAKKSVTSATTANAQHEDDWIKPRTLFTRAQEVARTGRKALTCIMAADSPYKDYVKTNLPSGMNHDDYHLHFVCEKMYVALNPSKQLDYFNDVVDAASAPFETRVEGLAVDDFPAPKEIAGGKLFAFPGYVVFALMGPIVEDFDLLRHRSDLLMSSTPIYDPTERKLAAGRMNTR